MDYSVKRLKIQKLHVVKCTFTKYWKVCQIHFQNTCNMWWKFFNLILLPPTALLILFERSTYVDPLWEFGCHSSLEQAKEFMKRPRSVKSIHSQNPAICCCRGHTGVCVGGVDGLISFFTPQANSRPMNSYSLNCIFYARNTQRRGNFENMELMHECACRTSLQLWKGVKQLDTYCLQWEHSIPHTLTASSDLGICMMNMW